MEMRRPFQLFHGRAGRLGKLAGQVAAVPATKGQPGNLLCFVDEPTGQSFLVDTGSAYSILPFTSQLPAKGPSICSASKEKIKCWGRTTRTIKCSGHSFTWTFLKAEVGFPILGVDFLQHFNITVDPSGGQLSLPGRDQPGVLKLGQWPSVTASVGVVAARTSLHHGRGHSRPKRVPLPAGAKEEATCGQSGGRPPPVGIAGGQQAVKVDVTSLSYDQLLKEFESVVNPSKMLPPTKHKVKHAIVTTCPQPIASRYRRLDPEKLQAAKDEFNSLEQQGIVRKSSSPWATPLHMAKKKDGSW